MRKSLPLALLALIPVLASAAVPYREMTNPSVSEAAAAFPKPPKEYGAINWALGFPPPRDRMISDIDHLVANGGGGYMINSGGRSPKYLSPEYFDLMKVAVDECKKTGIKMWIDGEDGYPDGFAGGAISKDYPQLGMQGIIPDARCTVAGGQTVSFPLPTDTLGIIATPAGATAAPVTGGTALPIPTDGKLKWLAPSGGTSEVTVVGGGVEMHYSVVAGQTLNIQVPPDTRSIQTGARGGGGARAGGGPRGGGGGAAAQQATILPVPADGQFKWTAPGGGTWELTFVRHLYRSSPTRAGQREDGTRDKDSLYSLCDYLDPQAVAAYIKLVEETYVKYFPDEMGTTILGFRGDETDYTGFAPWTPKLLETFQVQKGYDLKPYIAEIFASPLTPEAQRVKADYWDVWSAMFRDNFYKVMQDWCLAHNMEYCVHLNHEEIQVSGRGESMVTNEGSFWRDMRWVGVPGIDNLNQIGPGIVADFPKLAASAAHLNGHPQVWEEEGGGPGANGKFIADYQLVRGVNFMNISGLTSAPAVGALQDPSFAIGWYVSRCQYLLASGRSAAQVALYHPTDSYWLGDLEADTVTVRLTTELLEHQIDFDHIDHDALVSTCTLDGGGLKNLSGQVYKAVVIPSCTVIQKDMLDRLRDFAKAGGKVIFVGRTPTMLVDKTFLHPEAGAPDLSFATLLEPTAQITDRVVAALPRPDVKLDTASAPIKYNHRVYKDGEVYFFFNESRQTLTRTATLVGTGQVQVWDAASGAIHALAGAPKAAGTVAVPLTLGPQEAKFIVIGPLPPTAAQAVPAVAVSQAVVALDGDWSVKLGGTALTSPLKSWEDLGNGTFNGIADYTKTFNTPATLPQGQRLYLDLGEVNEVAHIRVNGTDFEARSWPAYVWDVTAAIKTGANTLEVQVQVPTIAGRGGGGGGPAPAAGRGTRGAPGAPGGAGAPPAGNSAPGNVPAGVVGSPVGAGAAAAGGAAGRGAARGAPAGAAGRGRGAAAAAAPIAHGLIGPVRLIAQ